MHRALAVQRHVGAMRRAGKVIHGAFLVTNTPVNSTGIAVRFVSTIVDVSTFLLSPVTMLVKAASDVAGAVVQRL